MLFLAPFEKFFNRSSPLGMRLFVLVSLACLLTTSCYAASLRAIDVHSSTEASEVVLQVDEKVRYQQDFLPLDESLPARCYIDLYNTSPGQGLPFKLPVEDEYIAKVRTGIYATKTRIVVDLKGNSACTVTTSAGAPFLVRISVSDAAPVLTNQASAQDVTAEIEIKSLPEPQEPGRASQSTLSGEAKAETESVSMFQSSDFSAQEEMSVWGWVQLFSAVDTQKQHAEDHRLSRLKGRLGTRWEKDLDDDSSLDLRAAIDVDRIFYDFDQADKETDFDLHETYLQLNRSNWDLSFGKQRVRWGKSDQLSPVDSINPQDLRQFIVIDLEERALPSWMARGRWYGESIGLEAIVQPWFLESKIEYFDSDWAIYRNLRQAIIESPNAPDSLKNYARNIRVKDRMPSDSLENISGAARLTWQAAETDFAVSYHYGWETLPTITSFPVKNIYFNGDTNIDPEELLGDAVFTDERVQAEYRRQQTIGFEWETALDPVGFRGEIAHINKVAFLSTDLTSERKPVTSLVAGIDYTSATEWYLNLQGYWSYIHDYTEEILYFEEDTVSALGEIRKPVWRGNLEFAARYNYTISDQSSYLQPSVTLKYFRNLDCEVGGMFFSGDEDTLLGSYSRADQVYTNIRFSF